VAAPPTPQEITVSNRTLLRLLAVGTAFVLLLWLLYNVRNVLQLLAYPSIAFEDLARLWPELSAWTRL